MVSIKQKILRIWDNAAPSVRICCVKFAQRVVLAQTVASGPDLRVRLLPRARCHVALTAVVQHGGALDVSLDKVPLHHQSLDGRNLEAEATGLLDRMLGALEGGR